jgi:hypothetical protein
MNLVPFAVPLIFGSVQTIAVTSSAITVYNNWDHDPSGNAYNSDAPFDPSGNNIICSKSTYYVQLVFLILACLGLIFGVLLLTMPESFSTYEWKIGSILITFIWLAVTVISTILTHQMFNKGSKWFTTMKQDVGFTVSYFITAVLVIISSIYCFM